MITKEMRSEMCTQAIPRAIVSIYSSRQFVGYFSLVVVLTGEGRACALKSGG
jgi:hypothetical protein